MNSGRGNCWSGSYQGSDLKYIAKYRIVACELSVNRVAINSVKHCVKKDSSQTPKEMSPPHASGCCRKDLSDEPQARIHRTLLSPHDIRRFARGTFNWMAYYRPETCRTHLQESRYS